MKVGMAVVMQNPNDEQPDHEVYREEIELADRAEPLGFDSLWCVEHHFDDYAMVPDPVQLLTFMAGRTERILLGTAIIVLPWHDPIRVAESLSVLDTLSGGRLIVGFGRGGAKLEYDGFGVDMNEARERFVEAGEAVKAALATGKIAYQGKHIKIEERDIRPRPSSDFADRLYGAAISPETSRVLAQLGFGFLGILQGDWKDAAQRQQSYADHYRELWNKDPIPPIMLTRVILGNTEEEAKQSAWKYIGRHWEIADRHYGISRGDHTDVKGYEHYSRLGAAMRQMSKSEVGDHFVNAQIFGTPDSCREKILELANRFGSDHFVAILRDGGMPLDVGMRNMDWFAQEVMPALRQSGAAATAAL